MNIKVKLKNVYGNDLIYPVCDKAKAFAAIAGKKTLTKYDISEIQFLGYMVNVVSESLGNLNPLIVKEKEVV